MVHRESITIADCDYLDEEFDRDTEMSSSPSEHYPTENTTTNPTPYSSDEVIQIEAQGPSCCSNACKHFKTAIRGYIIEPLETIICPEGKDSYLSWSIINCLCCCMMLGALAILFSVRSRRSKEEGK